MKQIPQACQGVKCMIVGCPELAAHKIGEENIWSPEGEKEKYEELENAHNLTTYICEKHFKIIMEREVDYMKKDNRFY